MSVSAYRPHQYIEAGLLVRGSVRLALVRAGVEFKETKSFGTSIFQVKTTPEHWRQIHTHIRTNY